MLKIVALYLCLTIFLVSGNGNDTKKIVPTVAEVKPAANVSAPVEPTQPPAPDTTTIHPNTTTITTTTTKTPTTTSAAPNTTTVYPNTTTATPPTTPATPNTTTVATTTTSVAPITTVAPVITTTPAPAPQIGEWSVSGKNVTCIVVKMALQFNVTYLDSKNQTKWQELTLPTDNSTIASGQCGDKEQSLNLTWHSQNDSLLIHFAKNDTGEYFIHHVEVSLESQDFPDIKSNETVKLVVEGDQFRTKLASSYKCLRLQELDLTRSGVNKTVGKLQITNLQFQAFKQDKGTTFGAVQDCTPDVPDLVPIAVGCVLTVLVIIVLGAYLFGRRRSQARGYLSM